jgi:hypothetical protein
MGYGLSAHMKDCEGHARARGTTLLGRVDPDIEGRYLRLPARGVADTMRVHLISRAIPAVEDPVGGAGAEPRARRLLERGSNSRFHRWRRICHFHWTIDSNCSEHMACAIFEIDGKRGRLLMQAKASRRVRRADGLDRTKEGCRVGRCGFQ